MEAVTFSPDGEMLASATNNSTILLWQVDSERCSDTWNEATCQPTQLGTPLTGHSAQVQNVVFLSDTRLVSSSADGQLILWNLEKRFWYDHACRVVGRGFTDSERLQYITEKLNPALLNTVAWLSDPFDADPPEAPPSCIPE
jgi:WD40 repeat protein